MEQRIISWIVYLLGFLLVPVIVALILGRFFPETSTSAQVLALFVSESLWIVSGNYLLIEKAKARFEKSSKPTVLLDSPANESANVQATRELYYEEIPDEETINRFFSKENTANFANPQLGRVAHKIRRRSGTELLKGITLIALGCAAIPVLLFLLAFILSEALSNIIIPLVRLPIAVLLSLVFFYWIVKTFRLARRYLRDPYNLLRKLPQRPILYLRSFGVDSVINSPRRDKKTYEEILVDAANNFGPVLAVGRPEEELPPLGGLRFYFNEDEWKAGIAYLMSISQMVIFHADITKSLLWELTTSRRILEKEKQMITFLSWQEYDEETRQKLYESFKGYAEKIIGCALPEKIGNANFLIFENNWSPKLIEINNKWRKLLYENGSIIRTGNGPSSREIKESLKALFERVK